MLRVLLFLVLALPRACGRDLQFSESGGLSLGNFAGFGRPESTDAGIFAGGNQTLSDAEKSCECLDSSVVSLHHPDTGKFLCSGTLVSATVVVTLAECLPENAEDEANPLLLGVKGCRCLWDNLRISKASAIMRGVWETSPGVLDEESPIAVLLLDKRFSGPGSKVSPVPENPWAWARLSGKSCNLVSWGKASNNTAPPNNRNILRQEMQATTRKRLCSGQGFDATCNEALQVPSMQAGDLETAAVICDGDLLGITGGDILERGDDRELFLNFLSLHGLRDIINDLVESAPGVLESFSIPGAPAGLATVLSNQAVFWFGRR